jgi:hypothetical protein
MLFRALARFGLRLLCFLRFLHVVVAIVFRFGFVGLGRFGLRLIWCPRRRGSSLRGVLRHNRQRHCNCDERSDDNST